jgi:broad specificity phosphatase PhoE
MIIRHGEKPPASGAPQGIDAQGNPEPHSLTPRGWTRARALVSLFAPTAGPPRAGLARPAAIYAAGGTTTDGLRTRETVSPLAARLGLPVNTQFTQGDETSLAQEVARRTEPTLICWQHGELPTIPTSLAAVTPTPPTSWPGRRFDLIWTLTPAAGGWSFHQIPEQLLDGDSNQSIG